MKYINRYAACLFFVFGLYYFYNFLNLIVNIEERKQFFFNKDLNRDYEIKLKLILAITEQNLKGNFESLKLKIDYLQNLVAVKQNDIDGLKSAFNSNVNYYNNLVEKQKKILEELKKNSIHFYGVGNERLNE